MSTSKRDGPARPSPIRVAEYAPPRCRRADTRYVRRFKGFHLVRAGLVLTLGQEATVNLSLSLASVAETVTVTADSPLVETTSNAIERTITRTDLDTLPLAGRNFANLATLSPGVAGVGGGGVAPAARPAATASSSTAPATTTPSSTRSRAGSRSRPCASSPSSPTSSARDAAWRRARSSASSRARGPTTCRAACSRSIATIRSTRRIHFEGAGIGKAPFAAALRRIPRWSADQGSIPLLRLVRAAARERARA